MLKKGLALLLAVIMVFSLSGCSDILGGAFFLFLVATGDDSADKDEVFDFVSENEEELLKAIEAGDFSAYENKGFIKEIDADETVVDIHIRSVIEDIQRAMNIDFKGSCNALCLRLSLVSQNVVEVFENRHLLRNGIGKVVLIAHTDASVHDGLFNGLQAVLAANNQLAHGEDEVGLQGQRIFLFGVVDIDVQRIDVVGADR